VEADFEASLLLLSTAAAPHHVARTQLVYGEWLRRRRRRADARGQLERALTTFSNVGATAFANRAGLELAATGARARQRVDHTRNDLTVQEQRVAELAAAGATNGEIAAALFLSPHTVDYHLRKNTTETWFVVAPPAPKCTCDARPERRERSERSSRGE